KRKIRKPPTQPAMNVTPLEKPTARPPIQMKSPKKRAQRNDVMPWAIDGGRRCIAGDPTGLRASEPDQKIHRAGCAFVHLSREPSASAYCPQERLRSTRAPCSVQERTYPDGQVRSRPACAKSVHFAHSKLSTFPRSFAVPGEKSVECRRAPSWTF